jgi:hypothetical protein
MTHRYCVHEAAFLFPTIFQYDSRKYEAVSDMLTKLRQATRFFAELPRMSKYQIIDCIMEINKTASHEFLEQFSSEDLDLYLEHLMEVDLEEIALCA